MKNEQLYFLLISMLRLLVFLEERSVFCSDLAIFSFPLDDLSCSWALFNKDIKSKDKRLLFSTKSACNGQRVKRGKLDSHQAFAP